MKRVRIGQLVTVRENALVRAGAVGRVTRTWTAKQSADKVAAVEVTFPDGARDNFLYRELEEADGHAAETALKRGANIHGQTGNAPSGRGAGSEAQTSTCEGAVASPTITGQEAASVHPPSSFLTKAEVNLLLFLETCAVDQAGRVNGRHMNLDDYPTVRAWHETGFVSFGRIRAADVSERGSYWVRLSPAAMARAHDERRARSERAWSARTYRTTEDR